MEDYPTMTQERTEKSKMTPSAAERICIEHLMVIRKAWFETQDLKFIYKLNSTCKQRRNYTVESVLADVESEIKRYCKRYGVRASSVGSRAMTRWYVKDYRVVKYE